MTLKEMGCIFVRLLCPTFYKFKEQQKALMELTREHLLEAASDLVPSAYQIATGRNFFLDYLITAVLWLGIIALIIFLI